MTSSDIRTFIPQTVPRGPAYTHKEYPKMMTYEENGLKKPYLRGGSHVIVNSEEEEREFLQSVGALSVSADDADPTVKVSAADEEEEEDTSRSRRNRRRRLED